MYGKGSPGSELYEERWAGCKYCQPLKEKNHHPLCTGIGGDNSTQNMH